MVIYDHESRVLVLQRKDDADFWQSVTGTIEPGELPIQTAEREVLEETGIDTRALGYEINDCRQVNQYSIRPLWQHRYPPGTKVNTEFVFAVKVSGDENIQLTEHLSYRWLDKAQALDKVWSSTNRDAIARFVPDKAINRNGQN